jgi:hypothetical protein
VGQAGRPAGVPRPLALLVAGAFFMEMVGGTIIAIAAQTIARSFGVRSADIAIAITAYLVTVAIARTGHANTLHSALQQLAIGLGVTAGAVSLRIGEAVLGPGPAESGRTGSRWCWSPR